MTRIKIFFIFTILLLSTTIWGQNIIKESQDSIFTLLTNDSLKYWDFVTSCPDSDINKIGLYFDKNNKHYEYEYFDNKRYFYTYMFDHEITYSFNISNDTLYTQATSQRNPKFDFKIIYLSEETLILGYYNSFDKIYTIITYQASEDQTTKLKEW